MIREPALILMCGLPFAGKTTLARELASQRGWAYIALDAINTERGVGLDGQPIPATEWEQTYAEAYYRVELALQGGRSVVYDETNFAKQQREQLRMIASQYAFTTYVLYVATSEAEARQRWQQNRCSPQRSDVRDEDFAYVVERFEVPTPDEQIVSYDPSIPLPHWLVATFGIRD